MKTTIQSDFALTELRPSLTLLLLWDVMSVWTCLCICWHWGSWMQPPSQPSWSSCQDACWCILWAVVAGRITCFFATISDMSHEDNNTIWLCPYWATTKLDPCVVMRCYYSSVWTCLCICWNWGSWNAACKTIKLIVLSGCLLMYLVSSCSWEDHLFLRYDLWNVTWRQQYNLTLPLLSYDQAWPWCCYEMLLVSGLVFATVGIEGLEMQPPSQSSWSSCQDACWCILWAVAAGRITSFFATISEMSHEDNNTIWLCPYWATTKLDPGVDLRCYYSSVWTCLCVCWNWGSWNVASKSIKLIVLSGCLLMYIVSSCSREDHLFLRYDLWNVTWRQQYNLTLPLLSYDQAWPWCCHEMLLQ